MNGIDIERVITVVVFLFSLAGVFFKFKGKIEKNESEIQGMKDDLKRHSVRLEALADVKVIKTQVNTIFKMLEKNYNTEEKMQDKYHEMFNKLSEKIDSKKDKD